MRTSAQDRKSYRVVRLAGRPIIATPAKPLRACLAGLSQYRPVTKKRACLRAALRFCAVSGVDRVFAHTRHSPLEPFDDFGFDRWLDEARRVLGAPSSLATVIWPQRVNRKRIYVHLVLPSGTPIAFCKIALDTRNATQLKDEIDAVTALSQIKLASIRIPRILHHDATEGCRYVAYEPFPPDLTPLKHGWKELSACVSEIVGRIRRIDLPELGRQGWWQRFMRHRQQHNAEFLRQVDDTVASPVTVCRVQGDATPSNIFRSTTGIWICDWEFSSPAGPRWTDELSYYLATNHYQCLIRPAAVLAACIRRFTAAGNRASIGELALALAFLCGRSDPRALKIAGHWHLTAETPMAHGDNARIGAAAPYRLS